MTVCLLYFMAVYGEKVCNCSVRLMFGCISESHKALSCFRDASAGLLIDNFLLTMMSQVSQDCDARHLEVLYYLQVQMQIFCP